MKYKYTGRVGRMSKFRFWLFHHWSDYDNPAGWENIIILGFEFRRES